MSRPSFDETRKAQVVAAAMALREDRLGGGMALLTASAYGLMFSALSAIDVAKIECVIIDVKSGPTNGTEVGRGSGAHCAGALLKALGPLLEEAGKRPKLMGITGGRAIDKHRTPKADDGVVVFEKGEEFDLDGYRGPPGTPVTVTSVDHETGTVNVRSTGDVPAPHIDTDRGPVPVDEATEAELCASAQRAHPDAISPETKRAWAEGTEKPS